MSQIEQHFTSLKADGLQLAGSLSMSLKGLFRAEDGKIHLDSQSWLGEDGNSQLRQMPFI